MGSVIGDLIPLAVGVAISPLPITAVILMLFAAQARRDSAGYLIGWVAGTAAAVIAFTALAGAVNVGPSSQPPVLSSWIKLIVGLALALEGIREWEQRPRPGRSPKLPRWMSAINTITPGKAFGLGFLLAAISPKNLPLAIAAGVDIAKGNASSGGVVAVVVYTVIGASTVGIPVIAYGVGGARLRRPLNELKTWLAENNATVMSVLLVVIGAVLIGKGFGGLL